MNEFAFVLDASALARRFYDDIGKRNLDRIFSYPHSSFFLPDIAVIETASALLAACNSKDISLDEYKRAMATIYEMVNSEEINVVSFQGQYYKDCISILEAYKQVPTKSFNGVDALYIALSRSIAETLSPNGIKVVFITSDNKLYNAAKDELLFDAFHFWTCDLGCGHDTFIPKKGDKDREPRTKRCPHCQNELIIEPSYRSSNKCPFCSKSCPQCQIANCPSTYELDLQGWQ